MSDESLAQKEFAVLTMYVGQRCRRYRKRVSVRILLAAVFMHKLVCSAGAWANHFLIFTESRLAHVLFSIPAVKGLEFGMGFGFCRSTGSQANDPLYYDGDSVRTGTNNILYDALYHAAHQTMEELSADPKHLGARIGSAYFILGAPG